MINIDNIEIKYPLILAPMAGVTDSPFRTICKSMGASLMYTEFVSAEGIIRENTKTLDMIKFESFERPLGVQIFGDNPDVLGKSAKYIHEKFKPDLIDINFGCPVPKITKRGAGSAALKNLNLMDEISCAVVESVNEIPVTAKIRAGWDHNSIVAIDAGKILEKNGLKALTLHARTTKQGFSGKSDWLMIKNLKENINIPIIGNGDVSTLDDYKNMKEITNCDAVMIGRGALGNPWIFKEIKSYHEQIPYTPPSIIEILELCLKHINLLEESKNQKACINLSKKHINYYIKNFKNSSIWRKKIMLLQDVREIKLVIKKMKRHYFDENILY